MMASRKTNSILYCDYAATAPLRPEVRSAIDKTGERLYGNPSSIHRPGQAARVALEQARKTLAGSLDARPAEIIFTSGGTEANNLLLFGLLKPGDHVVTSQIEHPSIDKPLARLETQGVEVTRVHPAATGEISVDSVAGALRPNSRLLTIMAVNNETGVINDLTALGTLAAERGILFHTDAVQAFGKLSLCPEKSGIHYLSVSAHKLGGPKGVGLLYAREGVPLEPLHLGGSQETGRRGGTENVAGAVGFARAVQLALDEQEPLKDRLAGLRGTFLEELTRAGIAFQVNGNGYPGILNIRFPGLSGHTLVMSLDTEGVAASYGSSCASGAAKTSHVLRAMGLSPEEAAESVRFSFGYGTVENDVVAAAQVVARAISQMGRYAGQAATGEIVD